MSVVYEQNTDTPLMVKHHITLPRSNQIDVVDGKYQIHIDSPIHTLSNEFCKYYLATNTGTNNKYFAVVCERSFNVSIPTLEKLKHYSVDNGFVNLLTYGIVPISSDGIQRVVIIIDKYDYNATLENYITTNGSLDLHQIKNALVPTLGKALQFCLNYDICCGNINLQNILVLEGGKFCLKEFFISPPHFYQKKIYLAPEIVDCINYARKTTSTAQDVYAMGMTVYFAYLGLWAVNECMKDANYSENRLEQGTFALIRRKKKLQNTKRLPGILSAFIKGTTQDRIDNRFEVKHILDWANDIVEKLSIDTTSRHSATINFSGRSYNNSKALASSMYHNQEDALHFATSDVLHKWMQRNIDNGETAVLDVLISRNVRQYSGKVSQDTLFKILTTLDGSGNNIRITNTCFTCDAIPCLVFYSVETQQKQLVDSVMSVITNNWWQQFINSTAYKTLNHTYVDLLISLANTYTPHTASCSIERIMYTLNPYLPCHSPSVADAYVITLPECLTTLEKIASSQPERIVIDWRLIAFLSSRLGINNDTGLKVLRDFPNISNALVSQMVVLLATSSLMHPHIALDNLSTVIGQRLIELIEKNIHNIKLVKVLSDRINDLARDSNFPEMVSIISNAQIFHNDHTGYNKACVDVVELNKQIDALKSTERTQELSTSLGQKATVFISYILCFLVTAALVV
jgi:hypothetical protein